MEMLKRCMIGSTRGAALAARDMQLGRTILFIGDGSLQLTVQELSTMMRLRLKPIIFVLNNSGYTIERWLHGKVRKYNDIVNWFVKIHPVPQAPFLTSRSVSPMGIGNGPSF